MLTFAPTIDSQTTRLALWAHRTGFKEQDRIFGWVSLLTLLHGGYGRLPLVFGRGARLSGSYAVAQWLDRHSPAGSPLIPLEQPLGQRVEADFALYNQVLGSNVAIVAYDHLLPQRRLMIESFGAPVTALGRRVMPVLYGPLHWLFSTLLGLTPPRVQDAGLRIEALLDWTDRRVADGRLYFHGDRITLADIGLMGALAPLVLPDSYSKHLPPLEKLPPNFRCTVGRTRDRPSGRFVLRLYELLGERAAV